jgi:hypothetical protein
MAQFGQGSAVPLAHQAQGGSHGPQPLTRAAKPAQHLAHEHHPLPAAADFLGQVSQRPAAAALSGGALSFGGDGAGAVMVGNGQGEGSRGAGLEQRDGSGPTAKRGIQAVQPL